MCARVEQGNHRPAANEHTCSRFHVPSLVAALLCRVGTSHKIGASVASPVANPGRPPPSYTLGNELRASVSFKDKEKGSGDERRSSLGSRPSSLLFPSPPERRSSLPAAAPAAAPPPSSSSSHSPGATWGNASSNGVGSASGVGSGGAPSVPPRPPGPSPSEKLQKYAALCLRTGEWGSNWQIDRVGAPPVALHWAVTIAKRSFSPLAAPA